ncbi:DUF5069 domain-containing protein [Puniceicoccaceae bacterium K14]|nr:DUF5069 domain-containing protein [Puniceicoccaceae bacterium K14]
MKHYDYQNQFKKLYDKAVAKYAEGNRDKSTFFDDEEEAFIAENGWRVLDFYDYAEDQFDGQVPSYEIAQSIEQVRRDYFLHIQKGVPSENTTEASKLTPKTGELGGIVWLPRIIEKANGKIKGELCEDIMYCCGGDRRFLSTHDIHPAEFLRVVWAAEGDKQAIVDFVKSRSKAIV